MADKRKQAATAAKRYQKSEMACNKPQRAPKGDKHKYVVKACQDGKEKLLFVLVPGDMTIKPST
jgi:hypothetical protein